MLTLLLLLIGPAQAAAETAPMPCAAPQVLEAVERRLSRAGQPVTIDRRSIGEIPGQQWGLVQCAVRVHWTAFDTRLSTQQPAELEQEYRFTLELRRSGIFLLP